MSKEGMATQALAGEIAAAVLADENDGGCDISAGLFGPAFSAIIRKIATEYVQPAAAPAGDAVERLQEAIEGECEGLSISSEAATAILSHVCPSGGSTAPAVAYMVDGNVEQGLFFDKTAAENMAFANCGTVRPLVFADSTPAAPGIDLEQFREAVEAQYSAGMEQWCGGAEEKRYLTEHRDRLLALIDASPKGSAFLRATFEAWLPPSWSQEGMNDAEGDFVYAEEWVQGAWMGYSAAMQATSAEVKS